MAINEMVYQGNIWIKKYQPYETSYEAPLYKYDVKKKVMIKYPDGDPIYSGGGFSDGLSNQILDVSSQAVTVADGVFRQITFAPYVRQVEGTYINERDLYSLDKNGKVTRLHDNGNN